MKIIELLETIYQEYVVSSNLDEVEYDDEREVLTITFLSGSAYEYYDVGIEEYEGIIAAPSKGRYFWQHIRNTYDYKRIR